MQKNKLLLLVASLLTLGFLVVAAAQENVFREWRQIQRGLRSADGPLDVRLRQIVVPQLRVADRCVSCHVGMAPGETGLTGGKMAAAHPKVGHEPADFGCIVCHGGQGRATDKADAHGDVHFWPEPMVPRRYADAGCGSCHTHLAVPSLAALRGGRAAFERLDCLACHKLEGRGGTLRPAGGGMEGPDLSRAGLSGFAADWYAKHLTKDGAVWKQSFGAIPAADLAALDVLLRSRVGAPGLVEGKALFHSLGCRGCHKVAGVGGDDGPDLTREGAKDPGRIDFTHVPGRKDLAGWLGEHFRSPAAIVPGSAMPMLGLSEEEIGHLVRYMLSLRHSPFPEAYWPKDRIRAERFGEREFATDGATLYGSFCSACHGAEGQGMRYPGLPAFPAIANRDFLELAPDALILETVRKGRSGRRMPAWGLKDGGLRPAEVLAVAAYVRTLGGNVAQAPDPKPARWAQGNAATGTRLYAAYCASCHGPNGEGKEGTALANPVLLENATDTYLFETIRRGRRGTTMEGFGLPSTVRPSLSDQEIEDLVTFLRKGKGGA
ncbi:MAG: c-type cytochrome [Acidobacteria bacterium]|nr:c-type cytochrome [Acidobacteriota bacterium]